MNKPFLIGFLIFLTISGKAFAQEPLKIKLNGQDAVFPDALRTQGIPLGEKFPLLDLVDIEGNPLLYSPDKLYVINFWFVGCRGCKEEEPFLHALADSYKENPMVEFVGLCMSKESKIARYYKKNEAFGFRTFSINADHALDNYLISSFPSHIIIKNGIVQENFTFSITHEILLDWYSKRVKSLLEQG